MARLPYYCYLLLLLYLVPASSIAKDIWTINCGSSEAFLSASNITWEADDSYVYGGVSRTANNITDEDYLHAFEVEKSPKGAYSTLRAFEAEKPAKGCYTIPVGVGRKVLVRASFYYGNYDGKEEPPTFMLQFDTSPWNTIYTFTNTIISEEIIFVTKTNTTSICVARGSTGQTPFISVIRIAVLGEGIYRALNSSQALHTVNRVACSIPDIVIDKYFRYWSSSEMSLNGFYTILKNTATSFNTNLPDDLPPDVLQRAIAPYYELSDLSIESPYLSSTPKTIYFNMYFTEPARSLGDRSFNIYSDNQQLNSHGPVIPPYGTAIKYSSSVRSESSETVFDLVPTANATLSPVISAYELFVIRDVLSDRTDGRDVYGLSKLKHNFQLLQYWNGDPCLPVNYTWEWVACSTDLASPRVTSLFLGSYGLSGELPDFSSLVALEDIDMSNNSLTGDIPAFLGELPNLRSLNLTDNDFSTIPSSLVQNKKLRIDISGNPKLSVRNQSENPTLGPQSKHSRNRSSSGTKNVKGNIISIFFVCMMYVIVIVT